MANGNGREKPFGYWFKMGLAVSAGAAVTSMVVGGVAYLATLALSKVGAPGIAGSVFGASAPQVTDTRRGQLGLPNATAANGTVYTNGQAQARQVVA